MLAIILIRIYSKLRKLGI